MYAKYLYAGLANMCAAGFPSSFVGHQMAESSWWPLQSLCRNNPCHPTGLSDFLLDSMQVLTDGQESSSELIAGQLSFWPRFLSLSV